MEQRFTTNDLARMLRVSRVTVGHWIARGRLQATRTAGGHRRISRSELERFLEENNYTPDIIREYEQTFRKNFIYCWEFHHQGAVRLEHGRLCGECIVYLSRAQRCHVLMNHPGHKKWYCPGSCLECDYYRRYFSEE